MAWHSQNGYVTWNVDRLESAIRLGLNKVCEEGIRIDSIGIDTWGVDFVLLDQQGQRVGLASLLIAIAAPMA